MWPGNVAGDTHRRLHMQMLIRMLIRRVAAGELHRARFPKEPCHRQLIHNYPRHENEAAVGVALAVSKLLGPLEITSELFTRKYCVDAAESRASFLRPRPPERERRFKFSHPLSSFLPLASTSLRNYAHNIYKCCERL